MKTIAIPQFYCGPSGQKGLYNRQEVGLARAFAALGCRAVVLYPAPGAAAPTVEKPEPNVKIYYLPVRKLGAQAFFSSWQVLLDEQVDAVHVMGDNSPGVPSLYRFCRKHGILFYSQLGALKSTSGRAAVRAVMDLLLRRNARCRRRAAKPGRALRRADARGAGHCHHPRRARHQGRPAPCPEIGR